METLELFCIMGFFQTTEYGISLGEIMKRIRKEGSSTSQSRSGVSRFGTNVESNKYS
jgi:hypothetical protein